MRVIAGEAKGRRIFCPKGLKIRPAPDRLRESLFGILGDRVLGARVLDLFAGTGSLGIEAISRGASHALFIDVSPLAVRAIQRNLEHLGLSRRAAVWQRDAFRSVRTIPQDNDLVFIDPPYGIYDSERSTRRLDGLLCALADSRTIHPEGLAMLRHPARLDPPPVPLAVVDRRRYGSNAVLILSGPRGTEDAMHTQTEDSDGAPGGHTEALQGRGEEEP